MSFSKAGTETPAQVIVPERAKMLSGADVRVPLALVTGRLLARDMTKLVCLDLTGTKK